MQQKEQERLIHELTYTALDLHKQEVEAIVILDRSARFFGVPLKQILWKGLGRKVEVYFLNPQNIALFHGMDGIVAGFPEDKAIEAVKKFIPEFVKEHPKLSRALKTKNIAIIDDQEYQGRTRFACNELFKQLGAKSAQYYPISKHPDTRVYSWKEDYLHSVTSPAYKKRKFVSAKDNPSQHKAEQIKLIRQTLQKTITPIVVQRLRRHW